MGQLIRNVAKLRSRMRENRVERLSGNLRKHGMKPPVGCWFKQEEGGEENAKAGKHTRVERGAGLAETYLGIMRGRFD